MTSHVQLPEPTAEIVAVQDDLVTLSPLGSAPLIKNEVVYIIPHGPERDGKPREYLKAEVLRVRGKSAEAQVFESTAGVRVGDKVIQSGEMLSVALGLPAARGSHQRARPEPQMVVRTQGEIR
jgi:V/A-type H+-transporting ATPase subunit A